MFKSLECDIKLHKYTTKDTNLIDQGAFGKVYKTKDKKNVIKVINEGSEKERVI